MDTSKKYRRFGIGALIVLGVVILIAIIVIASTLNKTPKASTEDTNQPTTAKTEEKKDEEKDTKKEEPKPVVAEDNKPVEVETESMPSTGPEDVILPIVLIATSAYLISLNVSWAKRGLRDEEQA